MKTTIAAAFAAPLLLGLTGCASEQVHVDPGSVRELTLRVAGSAQGAKATFCPGQIISLELLAKLADGSMCSSGSAMPGCMGRSDAIIDPGDARVQGSSGSFSKGQGISWMPDPNPLTTAVEGLTLRAFVEAVRDGRPVQSKTAELSLDPEYSCLQEAVFQPPALQTPATEGGVGPALRVAITTFSTPRYPDAVLVRVDSPLGKTYLIGATRGKPVTIISKGQRGGPGVAGVSGIMGADGPEPSSIGCHPGRPGMNGMDGGQGGPGGRGGPGGPIQIVLDEAVIDKLKGWLSVGSVGGDGGPGGAGGRGGTGGRGSRASNSPGCTAQEGNAGKNGVQGRGGAAGPRGVDGPQPTFSTGARKDLFGDDLPLIERIEKAGHEKAK